MGKIFIGNIRGPKGDKGDRGSNWKEGTTITGTSTDNTAFPDSGIINAMVDDQYLNTDTGNLYTCTIAGDPDTAMWIYTGNIKGPKGNVEDGVIEFSESTSRENISSGDSVSTVFGKIKKWFSDLGSAAFMNVVNNVTQSEAGQAVLDAAVGKYLEEKKFDISKIVTNRNITEPGFVMDGKTVADALTELNSNMFSGQRYVFEGSVKDLEPGMYFCTPYVSDLPGEGYYFVDIVSFTPGNTDKIIRAHDPWNGRLYALCRLNGSWTSSWCIEALESDLESFGFPNARIVEDLHTIQQSCFFRYNAGAANSPSSDRGGIGVCIYANDSWRFLLVIPYNTVDMYVSTIDYTGMWTTWTKK